MNPISIPVESNLHNVHPDALLACELFNKEKSNNRYIGSTFLCCILCGIFLDRYLFEFCGVSNEYEITWETPPNCEKTSEYENFCNDVNQLMIQVQTKQPLFTATLRHPHFIDSNKRTNYKKIPMISKFIRNFRLIIIHWEMKTNICINLAYF